MATWQGLDEMLGYNDGEDTATDKSPFIDHATVKVDGAAVTAWRDMGDDITTVLEDAEAIVEDRENKHGAPEETHRRIARLWEAYLDLPTGTIENHDAAVMLGLLKDARIRENPKKRDSWVDRAGYVDCGYRCVDGDRGV